MADVKALECRCCEAGQPAGDPRVCPECGHVFRGNGWDGIDAHWRAKHESIVPYEVFWHGLCDAHGGRRRRVGAHRKQIRAVPKNGTSLDGLDARRLELTAAALEEAIEDLQALLKTLMRQKQEAMLAILEIIATVQRTLRTLTKTM